ncbi:MAG TPA: YeiH family protein [Clostridiales bacterium]|nr:YeiH family protein [Clostridiales bacterium]
MEWIKEKGKGIALCFLIAVAAWLAVAALPELKIVGAPVIAIIFGMILALFLKKRTEFDRGISFTAKKILQYAIILLGFGLNLATVGKVGLSSLPIILSTISTALIVAFVMHRMMSIPGKISTLVGIGSSICGGSAIAATAPVIKASDEEIAQSISVIFFFNVIAAVIFPTLGGLLHMSNEGFALFAGTAINDTSSVTAAAATWDTLHGTNGAVLSYATVVKLTRTLAIIPITLILAFYQIRRARKGQGEDCAEVSFKKIFPMFILYFILASLITTVFTAVFSGTALTVAEDVFAVLKEASKFLIVMAMAAIGLNTNIVKLLRSGGKPLALGFICWVCIACVSLLLQKTLGIW